MSDDDRAVAATELSLDTAQPTAELPIADPRRYHRGEEIGHGGLGRVIHAEDARFGRRVAIKELLHGDRPGGKGLLLREALLTARLQHPGVAPIYDAGYWPDGSPFYSMKLIEGQTLAALIAKTKTPNERLALLSHVIAVADTVAYAHSRGVIHRDIKPANVVVGAFGETVVLDWGIAERQSNESSSGVAGTIGYMAPEQERGEKVDARADVFALGATLYHVLAGAPLGKAELPAVAPDLQAILDKALAREPDARYGDATAMAADLRRFSAGQLVSVYRYSVRALIVRWLRRHKVAVGVAAALTAVLAIVIVYAIRAETAAKARDAERTRVLTLMQARSSMSVDGAHGIAWLKTLRSGDLGFARVLAAAANSRGVARSIWPVHSNFIHAMVVSPDRKIVATTSRDRTAQLRDIVRGTSVALAGHTDEIFDIAFDADGEHVATASGDGTARVWTRDGREVWRASVWAIAGKALRPDLEDAISSVVVLDRGQTLVTGDRVGRLAITRAGKDPVILARTGSEIDTLRLGRDGIVAARSVDNSVRLIRLDGSSTVQLTGSSTAPAEVAGVAGLVWVGDRLATATGNTVTVWSGTGAQLDQLALKTAISRIATDGNRVLIGDAAGTVHLWSPGHEPRSLAGPPSKVLDLATIGPDRVLAGGDDGHLYEYDFAHGVVVTLRGHDGIVNHVAVADGVLLSAGADGTVRSWRDQPPVSLLAGIGSAVESVASDPDGTVAVGRADGAIDLIPGGRVLAPGLDLFDVAVSSRAHRVAYTYTQRDGEVIDHRVGVADWSGRTIATAKLDGRLAFPAWSADGSRLAVSSSTDRIAIFDASLGLIRELRAPGNVEARVVFTPDGNLVSSGWDGSVRLWNVTTGEHRMLGRHRGPALSAAVSHRGDLVASVGSDGTVLLHDIANTTTRELGQHTGALNRVVFGPDDRMVVTGGRDLALGVWPIDGTGRLLRGHSDALMTLTLSTDGRLAATAAQDGTVRLWDLASGESEALDNTGKDPSAAWFSGDRLVTAANDGTVRSLALDIPDDEAAFHAWLDALTTFAIE